MPGYTEEHLLLLIPLKMFAYALFLAWHLTILYSSPASADMFYGMWSTTSNYTTSSTFWFNRNTLLSSLSSNTPASGYANSTKGSIPDRVYGLALCRGDVDASDCRSCIGTVTEDIMKFWPYVQSAVVGYDYCLLRYSNEIFFSSINTHHKFWMCNTTQNTIEPDRLNTLVGDLLRAITSWAVHNSSGSLFATGEMYFMEANQTIYGLVQCTRDLSADKCGQCLQGIIKAEGDCSGRIPGRSVGWSCNFRYEVYPFYVGASKVVISNPPAVNALALAA